MAQFRDMDYVLGVTDRDKMAEFIISRDSVQSQYKQFRGTCPTDAGNFPPAAMRLLVYKIIADRFGPER